MKKPNHLFLEFPHFLQELNKTVSLSLVSAHYISFLCPRSFPQTHGNYRSHAHTLSSFLHTFILANKHTHSFTPWQTQTQAHSASPHTPWYIEALSLTHTHTYKHIHEHSDANLSPAEFFLADVKAMNTDRHIWRFQPKSSLRNILSAK